MSKTLKLISLTIAGAAILSILMFYNFNFFTATQEERVDTRDIEEAEDIEIVEEVKEVNDVEVAVAPEEAEDFSDADIVEDAEFAPSDNPYRAYIEARENAMPILLEFYART
jgi:hypothetical protein